MKRALVVDDTKNIRMMLAICLSDEGYEVVSADNGYTALSMLLNKENDENYRFDVAFLDIKMPGLSGTAVLKQVRSNGVNTPIVMITAFATVKNAIECTKYGANAYLQKPFSINKITLLLKQLFENSENPTIISTNAEISKYETTKQKLDDLLKKLPEYSDNPTVYRQIGQAYAELGNQKKAEQFIQCANVFENS